MKKQQECCDQILKRLDKLDDILAALKNLQGENDKLRGEIADLRNQHNALRDQVAALPKPLTRAADPDHRPHRSHWRAKQVAEEAQKQNQKFSPVGLDVGAGLRAPGKTALQRQRPRPVLLAVRRRRHAARCRRRANSCIIPDSKEGQFDIGLVNRWGTMSGGRIRQLQVPRLQAISAGQRAGSGRLPAGLRIPPRPDRRCSAPRASRITAC